MGSLDELCTQYYGAQLLDAVEFMHSRGVIHRDLKPENILLDHKMRIKITDFGTAKLLANEVDENGNTLTTFPRDYRASSFVGTAEYVSPELLSEKSQGKGCDIWAFGCIIYQMLSGRPPFKASNEYQTFQKIVKLDYSFPQGFPSLVRDLINHILVLDPKRRLSVNKIKAHPFFEEVNWSHQVLWKQKHPRLLPFRPSPRAATNPISRITSGFPRHGNHPPSGYVSSSQTNLARNNIASEVNPRSASTSNILTTNILPYNSYNTNDPNANTQKPAAEHPSVPPSSISAYSQTRKQQQLQRHPTTQAHGSAPRAIQSQTREQQAYTTSQNLPQRQFSRVEPHGSSPTGNNRNPEYNQNSSREVCRESTPNERVEVKPLDLPPVSSFDEEYASLMKSRDERALKVGIVYMTVSNDPIDPEKEPSRISRMFSGRKKKRTLAVTTKGRMLIIGDGKLQLDLPVSSPSVKFKELPFNKKLNTHMFSIETRSKVYTFEEASSSADWKLAFDRAREYVANAEAVSKSKSRAPSSSSSASAPSSQAVARSAGAPRHMPSTRRSTDLDRLQR